MKNKSKKWWAWTLAGASLFTGAGILLASKSNRKAIQQALKTALPQIITFDKVIEVAQIVQSTYNTIKQEQEQEVSEPTPENNGDEIPRRVYTNFSYAQSHASVS